MIIALGTIYFLYINVKGSKAEVIVFRIKSKKGGSKLRKGRYSEKYNENTE